MKVELKNNIMKTKEIILIEKISELTDINAHTEAVIELAKYLNDKQNLEVLNSINLIHNYWGSMPMGLQEVRTRVRVSLIDKIDSEELKGIILKEF